MVSTNVINNGKYEVWQKDHETLLMWRKVYSSHDLDKAKKQAVKRADKGRAYMGQVRL